MLVELRCGWCAAFFYMCRAHFRNHRYCRDACRLRARSRQIRAARRRHRQTEEGRLDHRDRMRAYRRKLSRLVVAAAYAAAISVVDQTTVAFEQSVSLTSRDVASEATSLTREVPDVPIDEDPPSHTCIVCGRQSDFILPFGELWPRRR